MGKYSGISAVSVPMVCGAGAMASLLYLTHIQAYLPSAIAVLLLAAMTVFAGLEYELKPAVTISDKLPFWLTAFMAAGALSYSAGVIVSPTALPHHPLATAAGKFGAIIDTIPFRDSGNNALLKAFILGDRSGLSAVTVRDFRSAGAAHLLALSGMHLGIIYLAVHKALSVFGNRPAIRKIRSVIVIAATGLYTSLCGAGPSLMRAWLFILLNESAKILERPQPPQQIFCAALTLHLICRPENITAPGFQLSYLAMIGIVFIWPSVRDWMDSKIWQVVSLSVSCQLFTAPLTLYYFGTFPKYFMITNLLAAPLTSVVMFSGIMATAAHSLGISCIALYRICEMPSTVLRWLLGIISGM